MITFKSKIGYISIIESFGKISKISINNGFIEEKSSNNEFLNNAKEQLLDYFENKREYFDLSLYFVGTEFEKSVWSELLKIPYGKVISYKQLAEKIAKPKAYRAVGNAVGKNPIPIIIPCHRVIASNNYLGGFSLGIDKKIELLKIEHYEISKLKFTKN